MHHYLLHEFFNISIQYWLDMLLHERFIIKFYYACSFIPLRTAFATYLLSIILFVWNIWYGGVYMLVTGALMVLAAITYCITTINDPPLTVHFKDGTLRPKLSWAFHLTLYTGVLATLGAITVLLGDRWWPRKVAAFFHHSTTQDDAIFEVCAHRRMCELYEFMVGEMYGCALDAAIC